MKLIARLVLALALIASVASAEERGNGSVTTGEHIDDVIQRPIAVALSNEPDYRPQVNLSDADVVYEVELTGIGETGYLAIYNTMVPEEVAYCSAARLSYLEIAADWGAPLVHVGVIGDLNEYAFPRFDGLSKAEYFYRDTSRLMPENARCRLKLLADTVDPSTGSPRAPLGFSGDAYTAGGSANTVFRVRYNRDNGYYPSYQYMQDDGLYHRFYNRAKQDDASGAAYTCANVIVMQADYAWNENDPSLSVAYLTGSNHCDYFIAGRHITGIWVRESAETVTAFYDDDGNLIVFRPGRTFIHIIHSRDQLEVVK